MRRRAVLIMLVACASACATAGDRPAALPASTPPQESAGAAALAAAERALRERRLDDALAALDRGVARGDGAAVRLLRGRCLGMARRFDEAAEDLARAVALEPANGVAHAALAAVQVNRGDELRADRAFAGAVRVLGEKAAAEQYWTQLLSMPPDPLAPQESLERCTRGAAALRQGRHVDAQREAINALRYAPKFGWCITVLADATARLGDPRGEEMLRRAIAEMPDRVAGVRADAKAMLARLMLERGAPGAEAAALVREALAVRGERGALLDLLGRACDRGGDAACARDAYARLLSVPELPEPLRRAAEARLAAIAPSAPKAAPTPTPTPLFPVLDRGKWGFIDPAGTLVIPPRFDRAGPFSEGLAAVQLGARHGYVDASGELVLEPAFAPGGAIHRPFRNGRAAVKVKGGLGYVDRRGEIAVPGPFVKAEDFSEGLALTCVPKTGCGYVDATGRGVIGPGLAGGMPVRGGVACAVVMKMMARVRVTVYALGGGRIAEEFDGCGSMSEGVIPVRARDVWGYVDGRGKHVVPGQFAWAGDFSGGLAPARDERGACGYIGRDGRFVIAPRFTACHPFSGGLARVDLAASSEERERVAFIDRRGELVVEGARASPPFDSAADFSHGLAAVGSGGEPFLAGSGPQLGYIDTAGRYVWTPRD